MACTPLLYNYYKGAEGNERAHLYTRSPRAELIIARIQGRTSALYQISATGVATKEPDSAARSEQDCKLPWAALLVEGPPPNPPKYVPG